MFAPDQTAPELALPTFEVRAVARRLAVPALLAGAAVLVLVVAGGRLQAFVHTLGRGLDLSPGWALAGIVFECASLAGYVALLALVGGRATRRIGARESVQITFAGAAATRLLPTAGAGGAALALWTFKRAGLRSRAAVQTLLVFFVLLYCVFLGAIAVAGAALALGLVANKGPVELSAVPAAIALVGITLSLTLAFRGQVAERAPGRLRGATQLLGAAVRDACHLVRTADPRLAGAVAYWVFDAAVLWAMLHVFGSPPAIAVLALAYLVGQVATTLPIPGAVSGGMAGVLIAFGVPAALALPAVLAYRTVAVWLPSPVAVASVPGLRATIARWGREDAAA